MYTHMTQLLCSYIDKLTLLSYTPAANLLMQNVITLIQLIVDFVYKLHTFTCFFETKNKTTLTTTTTKQFNGCAVGALTVCVIST